MENRKTFIKKLLFGIGLIGIKPGHALGSSGDSDCEDDKGKLFLRLQEAEMKEKAAIFSQLTGQFGEDVLRIVRDYVISNTEERLRLAELDKRDMDAVIRHLWAHTGLTHQYTTVTKSDRCMELKVTRCFYAETMRRLNAATIGDVFYCAYDYGFCKGLNPKLRFTRTQTLMQGDPCCNHRYEFDPE